jgi:hypothetical protein
MATLYINDADVAAKNFLNYAMTLPFVNIASVDDYLCRYSDKELKSRALQAIDSYRQGNVISHDEMKKRFAV